MISDKDSLIKKGEDLLAQAEKTLETCQAAMAELEGMEITRDSMDAFDVLATRVVDNIKKVGFETQKILDICADLMKGERLSPRQLDCVSEMIKRSESILGQGMAMRQRHEVYSRELATKMLNPEALKGFEELVSQDRDGDGDSPSSHQGRDGCYPAGTGGGDDILR